MKDRPAKGVHYLSMGPWPGYIGVVFTEKAFQREMKRLNIKAAVNMLGHERAGATLHEFINSKSECVWLLALGSTKGRSKEQCAGLVAHEAMHVVQYMRKEFGELGVEAEAYLIQMIVQDTLQLLWKSSKVRSTNP